MKNFKFLNNDSNVWSKVNIKNGYLWHTKQIDSLKLQQIKSILYKNKNINIKLCNDILLNLNCHFGLIIKYNNIIVAATDVARTYPVFFSEELGSVLISPQAKIIAQSKRFEINKKQLLAYQMSGYTSGSETLWKNISGLLAGQFLLIDKKLSINSYYNTLSKNNINKKSFNIEKKLEENIFDMLKRIILKANNRNIVIPLSSGLDSRLIVSGLKYLNYKNVKCFSYGLKNNYEAKVAKNIAKKLDYKWDFVEISQKDIKTFYNSRFYKNYFDKGIDGCATPGIQDIYTIYNLKKKNYFSDSDIIINGNSGDYITGGHLPTEAKIWQNKSKIINAFKTMNKSHLNKHYSLWAQLRNNKNDKIISELLYNQIKDYPSDLNENIDPFILYELLEFHNRQTKFVINLQRIYDFYNIDWLLPLWDKEVIDFWKNIPIEHKINQKLYKNVLHKLNLSDVWSKEFVSQQNISPYWMKPLRIIFKSMHIFSNKNKWYTFEKKYLNYWMDIICAYSMLSYKEIIKNNFDARNSIAWHTLIAEKQLFNKNWQNKINEK